MAEPETPDGVDAMYEQWVASLKRDKASASRYAMVGWAVALLLLVVLATVVALKRGAGDELEDPDEKEDDA